MYASTTSFAVKPGRRDDMVAHLRGVVSGPPPAELLLFEIGLNESAPDTVFLLEIWESEEAQQRQSSDAALQERMRGALPLIDRMSATRFQFVDPPAPASLQAVRPAASASANTAPSPSPARR